MIMSHAYISISFQHMQCFHNYILSFWAHNSFYSPTLKQISGSMSKIVLNIIKFSFSWFCSRKLNNILALSELIHALQWNWEKMSLKRSFHTSRAVPSSPTTYFCISASIGCPQFACANKTNIIKETTASLQHVWWQQNYSIGWLFMRCFQ